MNDSAGTDIAPSSTSRLSNDAGSWQELETPGGTALGKTYAAH